MKRAAKRPAVLTMRTARTADDDAAIAAFRRFLRDEMSPEEAVQMAGGPEVQQRCRDGRGTLTEARWCAGMTMGAAARALGWSRERIVAIEGGARTTEQELAALHALYGVSRTEQR